MEANKNKSDMEWEYWEILLDVSVEVSKDYCWVYRELAKYIALLPSSSCYFE